MSTLLRCGPDVCGLLGLGTLRLPQELLASSVRDGSIHLVPVDCGPDFVLLVAVLDRHTEKGALDHAGDRQLPSIALCRGGDRVALLLNGPLFAARAIRH